MNYQKRISFCSLLKSVSENKQLMDMEYAYDEFLIEVNQFIEEESDLNIVYRDLSYTLIELTNLHHYLDDVTKKKSVTLSN